MGAPAARPLDAGPSAPPPGETAPLRVYLALGFQVLISAGTYLTGKRAMSELSPATVVLWRFILSASVFALLLLLTPGPKLPPRHELRRIVFLGFLAGPVNQMFFFYGLAHSTAAHAALLYALTPLGVYCLSLLRGHERFAPRASLGVGLALTGVVVLLLGKGLASAQGSVWGDLLILAAVSAWVVYTLEGKPFAGEHGPIRATAWSMIAAAILCIGVSALLGLLGASFAPSAADALRASVPAQLSIAYLGLLTSVVAYLLWYYALSKLAASKVAIFSNLQPVTTALAAWLLLSEQPGWELLVGGALVLTGVRLTQRAAVVAPVPR